MSTTGFGTLTAVVLNYSNYDQTIECVHDLLDQDYSKLDIVVVDNNSPNESLQHLQIAFANESRVAVIETGENMGYAGGNNFGCVWRLSKGAVDYFLIVNNDVRLFDRTVLRQLVDFANSKQDLSGVGPKVVNAKGFIQGPYSKPNVLLRSLRLLFPVVPYAQYFWMRALGRKDYARPCYAVVGAFMLLKASPFSQVGMFDETTFLGAEEYILAERFLKTSLQFYYCPLVSVLHNHGMSTVARTGRRGWHTYIRGVESMIYYFKEYQKVGVAAVEFYRTCAMIYGRFVFPFRKYFM
ncbi:MAG: glycosyltransferase family 2 protein [Candidatus Atribacteria bacterium]